MGHSVTLLAGVLLGVHANAYLVDAVIGFSVVYKAFDNMDGFKRFLGYQPDTRIAVLTFGLFHGFGLATKLQDFSLPQRGLVTNIVSFNIGVEIGQVLALTAVLLALDVLAHASGLRALCLRHEHGIDDRRVPADRPAAGRLLPVSVMPSRARIAGGDGRLVRRRLAVADRARAARGIRDRSTRYRSQRSGCSICSARRTRQRRRNPRTHANLRPRVYKTESTSFTLRPSQAFEYKYRLEKDRGMVFAWKATAKVKYEFHGEPEDHRLKVQSYEKQEGDFSSGTLTAPFTGIHGWYWENAGERDLTITLTTAGFYTAANELRPKFDPVKHKEVVERVPHELQTPPGFTEPSPPRR